MWVFREQEKTFLKLLILAEKIGISLMKSLRFNRRL